MAYEENPGSVKKTEGLCVDPRASVDPRTCTQTLPPLATLERNTLTLSLSCGMATLVLVREQYLFPGAG